MSVKQSVNRKHVNRITASAVQPAGPSMESLEPRVMMSATDVAEAIQNTHFGQCPCGCSTGNRGFVGDDLLMISSPPVIDVLEQGPLPESAADVLTGAAALDVTQTFKLHSNAGAKHTIYLDFNGHTTTGTYWNSYSNNQPIVTAAFDIDGNAASFSTTEHERIQAIWQRVAEDFLPFDVNVTTEAPPSDALIKSGTSDTAWGVRVVVGGSSSDWFGSSAGGVAYMGSFNWNTDTPVFAFENNLGNGHEKYTAEAISHEVGHALGLGHDGGTGTEYFSGTGSGDTAWAPIMGVGYYRNLTQWSKGEYAGANNLQDDLAIITSKNGFGYRADDHGNTTNAATALITSGGVLSTSGIISRSTDADLFSFSTASGNIAFTINPASRGPNLDVMAELLNSAGTVLLTSNPGSALSATLATTVAAGNYFLRITGAAGPNASSYASLGFYTVTGSIIETAPQLSINDISRNESDSTATFTVSLDKASDKTISVLASTVDGTAKAGSDYIAKSQTLTFNPGETTKQFTVSLVADNLPETTEQFGVTLSSPTNATLADASGQATILDQNLFVSINDTTVVETDPNRSSARYTRLQFNISLNAVAASNVTVNWATANDTAIAGQDYISAAGSVTIKAGSTKASVTVNVIGDRDTEGTETMKVLLTGVTNASLGDALGIGTIIDNEVSVWRSAWRTERLSAGLSRSDIPTYDSPESDDAQAAQAQAALLWQLQQLQQRTASSQSSSSPASKAMTNLLNKVRSALDFGQQVDVLATLNPVAA
jgi:hypothetical protein